MVPIKDSRYALIERFLGVRGMIASTATINTQALAANCMVGRSKRRELGLAAGVVEVPDVADVLVLAPVLPARACSEAGCDVDEDFDD